MKNFSEMVDETQNYLRSVVRDQEMSTHLTADMNFSTLLLPVDDAGTLTRGRVEVDDELIWVDKADRGAGTGVIPPYGRGMDGTNKADHTAGTRVVIQPLYPRKLVKDTLNQAITAMGVRLYGVESLTMAVKSTTFMYELPAHTRDVLNVRVSDRRPTSVSDDPRFLRHWTFDKHAPAGIAPTGKCLYVQDACDSLDVLTVTIARDPAALMFGTQMFSETFLPATAWDVAVLTAASRLLSTANAYNIQGRSVEANSLDAKIDPNTAVSQSKYLYQMAQVRLEEERSRLLGTTVQRAHYSARSGR